MFRSHVFAAGGFVLLTVATSLQAQPGPAGPQPAVLPPGGGGIMTMRFGGGDPMGFFDMLARGKDVINRNELQPWQQGIFDRMAQAQGITNGQLTREQFRAASARFTGGQGGPGGGGIGMWPGGAGGGEMRFGPEMADRIAEGRFRRDDRDGDGLLKVDEMSETFRPVWDRFDTNKDGAINLDEYKSFMRDRLQQAFPNAGDGQPGSPGGFSPGSTPNTPAQPGDENRPPVYRAGKLPRDLPYWFAQLDTDQDGQVGLYEWVRADRAPSDFKPMDRNDDGLLTIEEAMAMVRSGNKDSGSSPVVAGVPGFPGGGDPRMAQFGRFGGDMPPGRMWMGMGGDGPDRSRFMEGRGQDWPSRMRMMEGLGGEGPGRRFEGRGDWPGRMRMDGFGGEGPGRMRMDGFGGEGPGRMRFMEGRGDGPGRPRMNGEGRDGPREGRGGRGERNRGGSGNGDEGPRPGRPRPQD